MTHPRPTLLALVALLAAPVGGQAAQVAHPATLPEARAALQGVPAGKKRGGSGPRPLVGKKSRVNGDLYDRVERAERGARARRVLVRLGDRVRGFTGAGILHRVAFEAPAGARVTLRVLCPARGARPTAQLSVPGASRLVPFRPVSPGARTVVLHDHLLSRSGTYEILVGVAGGALAEYVVTTEVRWPTLFEETVRLDGRRPAEVRIPGVAGRRIERLELRARPDSGADLYVSIVDPTGRPVATADRTWRSPRGERISVQRIEMAVTGDYVVRIMDRRGGGAEVSLRATFRNPRPGSKTHHL